jgi:DNA-binding XRE family transcriptional regulator
MAETRMTEPRMSEPKRIKPQKVEPPKVEPLWRDLAGAEIRRRRLGERRTLQQVAERAGISPQYLSEIERGRKEPSSEMLGSICGALGVRLVDLLLGAVERATPVPMLRLGFTGTRASGSRSGPVLRVA